MSSPNVDSASQPSHAVPSIQSRREPPPIIRPRFRLPWLISNTPSDQMPGSFNADELPMQKPGDDVDNNVIAQPTPQISVGRQCPDEMPPENMPATSSDESDTMDIEEDTPPDQLPATSGDGSFSPGLDNNLSRMPRALDGNSHPSNGSDPFQEQAELELEHIKVEDGIVAVDRPDPILRPYSSTQSLAKVLTRSNHRKWSSTTSRPLNSQQTFTKYGPAPVQKAVRRRQSQSQYTPSAYSSTPPSERDMPASLPRKQASSYERLVGKRSKDSTQPATLKPSTAPQIVPSPDADIKVAAPVKEKSPTWPMVPLSEMEIEIPARGSSLSKPPSSLGRYNDGTISRQPTVRVSTVVRSPEVSPKTELSPRPPQPPPAIPRGQGDLERAVTGLEDLMHEALTVAKEAALNNRTDDVAEILDEATLALRKASTVHGYMVSPLQISESESSDFSSEEYITGSDSDADIESNVSSMRPKPSISNETVPTNYSKSKSGLSLKSPPVAHFSIDARPLPLRASMDGKAQPEVHEFVPVVDLFARRSIVNPPFTMNGKRPTSETGYFSPTSSSADRSIMPTPPRMYQKPSTNSVATDWAYVNRRDLRGGSAPVPEQPLHQGDVVLPPQPGERVNIILPPESKNSRNVSIKVPEIGVPAVPIRFSLPEIPRQRSLRAIQSSPELPVPTVPNQTPQPVVGVPSYPAILGDVPSKRYKPHVGASRIFESPYYRVPEREDVLRPLPDRSNFSLKPRLDTTSPNLSLKHPRRNHISLRDSQGSRLHRYRRQPIAREWKTLRKRITAVIACFNTALVGLIAGIYAGEVPKIQYHMGDEHHRVILGNVMLYIGMGITTLIAWPLPLLHGRKPYTLSALALAIPLQFPQAIAVAMARGPRKINFIGLLLPRIFLGMVLGVANINFLATLFDLFGVSLQSRNPHQEIVVYDDIRRQGGGMGLWLGIWSWCAVGSLPLGFLIGAAITQKLNPSWGFYIVVILLSAFMVLNVVAPETRRAPYRRSILRYLDEEEKLKRRVARGEIKLHLSQDGPKYWWEEVWAGMKLMVHMLSQPGFFILALYLAWIYALVVLVTLLLGALLSRDYRWRPGNIGLAVFAVAAGALLAVPLSKANLFSRERIQPARTDSMTFEPRITWTSHLVRRCLFTFALPIAGLAYVLASPGRSVNAAGPTVMAAVVGFLSCLAISECIGLAMEAFDTSDLQPGVNSKHRLQSMESGTRRRRTNYSSFPRVCAGLFAAQGFGFFLAAAATGVSGAITRALGAQAATGCFVGILLFLTILLSLVLWRYKSVQVIPNHALGSRGASTDWNASPEHDEQWKPVLIGNPSGKMRRMNILELGAWSRWTEIRKLNLLAKTRHYVG